MLMTAIGPRYVSIRPICATEQSLPIAAADFPCGWAVRHFEPSLFEPQSLLPGNGIFGAETKRSKRLREGQNTVSEGAGVWVLLKVLGYFHGRPNRSAPPAAAGMSPGLVVAVDRYSRSAHNLAGGSMALPFDEPRFRLRAVGGPAPRPIRRIRIYP
jgi:hypothetical protein